MSKERPGDHEEDVSKRETADHGLSISDMLSTVYFFKTIIEGTPGMYTLHRPLTDKERLVIPKEATVTEKDGCTTIEIK